MIHRTTAFIVVLMLVALPAIKCQLRSDYLVCKPIKNLPKENSSSPGGNGVLSGPRGPPGPPGKEGAQGMKGETGPTGPQPDIDWDTVVERIDERIEERLNCSAGFLDRGYCYKLIYTTAVRSIVNGGKEYAANLCAFHGGELVDIDTQELYNKIYDYVKRTWMGFIDDPKINYVDIWLASRFQEGKVVSSTGGDVYVQWYPTYPKGMVQEMALEVATRHTRTTTGMWNVDAPSSGQPVPFCRFQH